MLGLLKRCRMLAILLLVTLFNLAGCVSEPSAQLTVSAAANLIPAFEEIGRAFEAGARVGVGFKFGSSGKSTT